MNTIKKIGKNKETGRDLYLVFLNDVKKFPKSLNLNHKYFGCLFLNNDKTIDEKIIIEIADYLLNEGLVYLDTWGFKAKQIHDIFDTEIRAYLPNETNETVILTSWNEGIDVGEAIWHFLYVCFPAEFYYKNCSAELVISVGEQDWHNKVLAALNKEVVASGTTGDPRESNEGQL